MATSNSLDVTSSAQGSGTTLNSGTATTTVGGDLILGEVTTADGVTYTAGSGFVIEESVPAAPNTKLIVEDAVQLAAGTVSAGATLSSSDNGGALLAAFKAASGTLSPSITSLTPNSGSTAGGTAVTITGTNFVSGAMVQFGGTAATSVVVVSSTQITAVTPAGSARSSDRDGNQSGCAGGKFGKRLHLCGSASVRYFGATHQQGRGDHQLFLAGVCQ